MTAAHRYDDANRDLWNAWTPIHAGSAFYDVAGFRAGRCSLKGVEREALGDVRGRRILHLQCHIGLDTLSLARLGAETVGIDYSDEAIAFARTLARDTGLAADFHCCNVYDTGGLGLAPFDIVFASYGVLHWLPDLAGLGRLIARMLKPGGFFYIVDFHPLFNMLDETGTRFVFPYFPGTGPVAQVKKGACMDPGAPIERTAYEWPHSLGEIVTAVAQAPLRVTALREYPFMMFNCLDYLEDIGGGRYGMKDRAHSLPLMFSLRADR